jgi:hypothetical protein
LICDASGGKLAQDQIEEIKTQYGRLSEDGKTALGKLADAHDQLATRTKTRFAETILATAGLHGPIEGIVSRLDYIQMTAERMGLSLTQLFSQIGASIVGVGGATAVLNEAIQLGRQADEAWKAAGDEAQGFFGNLQIGFGVKEIPPIAASVNFSEVGLKEMDAHLDEIKRKFEELTHDKSPVEKLKDEFRPQEQAIARRYGAVNRLANQADRIESALTEAQDENRPGMESLDEAAIKALQQAGIKYTGQNAQQMLAEAREVMQQLRQAARDATKGILADQKTLKEQEGQATYSATFDEEREKARIAIAGGNQQEADIINRAIAAASAGGFAPGTDQWKEALAEAKNFYKQLDDLDKDTHKKRGERERESSEGETSSPAAHGGNAPSSSAVAAAWLKGINAPNYVDDAGVKALQDAGMDQKTIDGLPPQLIAALGKTMRSNDVFAQVNAYQRIQGYVSGKLPGQTPGGDAITGAITEGYGNLSTANATLGAALDNHVKVTRDLIAHVQKYSRESEELKTAVRSLGRHVDAIDTRRTPQ